MLAACRLPRLPVRSGAAEEAPGSPLPCPGYCQPEAAAGCTTIAHMTISPVQFPTLLARGGCTRLSFVALDAYCAFYLHQ